MNTLRIAVGAALTAGTLVLSSPAAFAATPDPGPAFGQHVSQCARTMGFSATHNPGMHRGRAGWDGMSCDMSMP